MSTSIDIFALKKTLEPLKTDAPRFKELAIEKLARTVTIPVSIKEPERSELLTWLKAEHKYWERVNPLDDLVDFIDGGLDEQDSTTATNIVNSVNSSRNTLLAGQTSVENAIKARIASGELTRDSNDTANKQEILDSVAGQNSDQLDRINLAETNLTNKSEADRDNVKSHVTSQHTTTKTKITDEADRVVSESGTHVSAEADRVIDAAEAKTVSETTRGITATNTKTTEEADRIVLAIQNQSSDGTNETKTHFESKLNQQTGQLSGNSDNNHDATRQLIVDETDRIVGTIQTDSDSATINNNTTSEAEATRTLVNTVKTNVGTEGTSTRTAVADVKSDVADEGTATRNLINQAETDIKNHTTSARNNINSNIDNEAGQIRTLVTNEAAGIKDLINSKSGDTDTQTKETESNLTVEIETASFGLNQGQTQLSTQVSNVEQNLDSSMSSNTTNILNEVQSQGNSSRSRMNSESNEIKAHVDVMETQLTNLINAKFGETVRSISALWWEREQVDTSIFPTSVGGYVYRSVTFVDDTNFYNDQPEVIRVERVDDNIALPTEGDYQEVIYVTQDYANYLQSEWDSAESDLVNMTSSRDQWQSDYSSKVTELNTMTGLRDGLQTDLNAKTSQLSIMTADRDQWQSDYNGKVTELATMTGLRDGLQIDFDNKVIELTTMTDLRDGLQTDLNVMTGLRDGLQTDLNVMTGLRDGLQTDLDDANDTIISVTGQRDQLQLDLNAANNSISTLTGERDTLQGQLTTANDNVNTLTGQLNTANNTITTLTGERDTAISERDAEIAAHAEADDYLSQLVANPALAQDQDFIDLVQLHLNGE